MATVVDRTTKSGTRVEIRVRVSAGQPVVESVIDGRADATMYQVETHRLPALVTESGYSGLVGRVAVTRVEMDAIEAELARLRAECEASPAGLRTRREGLALTLSAALGADRDQREAAWEREDEAGAFRTPKGLAERIEVARTALTDFDRDHPEVLAAIKAENRERAERHAWD